MFYAAATLLYACDGPERPTSSLQCAISALNKDGFDFPAYKGDVEKDCDDAIASYRKKFFPAVEEYLKCGNDTDERVKCIMDIIKAEDYDAYILVLIPAMDLDQDGKLDSDWKDNLEDLTMEVEKIQNEVEDQCYEPEAKKTLWHKKN